MKNTIANFFLNIVSFMVMWASRIGSRAYVFSGWRLKKNPNYMLFVNRERERNAYGRKRNFSWTV